MPHEHRSSMTKSLYNVHPRSLVGALLGGCGSEWKRMSGYSQVRPSTIGQIPNHSYTIVYKCSYLKGAMDVENLCIWRSSPHSPSYPKSSATLSELLAADPEDYGAGGFGIRSKRDVDANPEKK